MESKKELPAILIRCILCCRLDGPNSGFFDIDQQQMPNSKKTIKSVLLHLSKCIKEDINFDFSSCMCSSCFEKLIKYDEVMVELLTHQKEIGHMLRESIEIFKAQEIDIKSVHDDSIKYNFELVTEELDNENESVKEEAASQCTTNNSDDDDDEASGNESTEEFAEPSFSCSICENEFKSNRALQMHLKSHAKFVMCAICGAERKDEEYLELHMNIHEGKTENECRYCPKRYTRRSHVIRHMQLHWDKKKYQCEKCGLRFSQANILYNHKMNHEAEEEPLICNICHQSFKTKRTFKHHMITHQEDRPMYPCNICGKVFTQKYTIKSHLRTHTDGYEAVPTRKTKTSKNVPKEFPCIICDKVMATQESLEAHMAQQHDVISTLE